MCSRLNSKSTWNCRRRLSHRQNALQEALCCIAGTALYCQWFYLICPQNLPCDLEGKWPDWFQWNVADTTILGPSALLATAENFHNTHEMPRLLELSSDALGWIFVCNVFDGMYTKHIFQFLIQAFVITQQLFKITSKQRQLMRQSGCHVYVTACLASAQHGIYLSPTMKKWDVMPHQHNNSCWLFCRLS